SRRRDRASYRARDRPRPCRRRRWRRGSRRGRGVYRTARGLGRKFVDYTCPVLNRVRGFQTYCWPTNDILTSVKTVPHANTICGAPIDSCVQLTVPVKSAVPAQVLGGRPLRSRITVIVPVIAVVDPIDDGSRSV